MRVQWTVATVVLGALGVEATAQSDGLFYVSGGSIVRSDIEGRNPAVLLTNDDLVAYDALNFQNLAVDADGGKLYWQSETLPASGFVMLFRSNLDGSGIELLLSVSETEGNRYDFLTIYRSASAPAVGTWALVVLAAMLTTGATVILRQRAVTE